MNNFCVCENCKHFIMSGVRPDGVCSTSKTDWKYVRPTDTCINFEPCKSKVKPRRLCDFCERSKFVLGGLGRYSMTMGHIVSIGAKNTMSITSTTLTVTKKGAAIEDEKFPIKYCPLCGRKLE